TALKQKQSIAQDVGCFVEMRKAGSMLTISLALKPENQARAIDLVAIELAKLLKAPIPANELARMQRLIENNYLAHYESFQNQAQGLCWYSTVSDVYEMASWLPAIRALKCDDITKLANQYLNWQNAALSTVAPMATTISSYRAQNRLPAARVADS